MTKSTDREERGQVVSIPWDWVWAPLARVTIRYNQM